MLSFKRISRSKTSICKCKNTFATACVQADVDEYDVKFPTVCPVNWSLAGKSKAVLELIISYAVAKFPLTILLSQTEKIVCVNYC